MSARLERTAYAGLFLVVLPVALVLWARTEEPRLSLVAIRSVPAGAALVVAGFALFAAAVVQLTVRGGDLPLNAFPPPRLVRTGVYRWVANPMYLGFSLLCAGVSIAVGSRAGLWLVTPAVGLASLALVYGFERHDLVRRFGPEALRPPLLSLPRGAGEPPTAAQRAAVVLWVLVPWLLTYYAAQALTPAHGAFRTALPFERNWPVLQWTELVYASVYLLVPLTVLLIRTQHDLRRYGVQSVIATVFVGMIWFVIPVVATNRPIVATSLAGRLLAFEQSHSTGVAAFPAFHVLWAMLAGLAWSANARVTGRMGWRWVGWGWAWGGTLSCLTTGMHTVLEVGAALLILLPLRRYEDVWERVRRGTERVANSWREWRFGKLRVINHGAWAAAAAAAGMLIAGSAAGPGRVGAVVWIGVCILVGAGLWAQALEGSSKLLRPFGWYGGVLGAVVGAVTARLAGVPLLPVLAAYGVAAPWIQILGRFRCLVQGCCHGRPASPNTGIRYLHRRSRVTQLADLGGRPLHATPLYSIVGNLILGVLLLRLRVLRAPDPIIVSAYLMLAGMTRFVEESYRGEPQTAIVAGLRVYQWLAILSVVIGAVCSTIPWGAPPPPLATPGSTLILSSLALGLVTGAAMGVDFPESNRRFSRLAAAD